MALTLVLIWLLSAVLAYCLARAACVAEGKTGWDRPTREFVLVCSILLGPVFLLIAAELFLMAEIGRGLTGDHRRKYRDT